MQVQFLEGRKSVSRHPTICLWHQQILAITHSVWHWSTTIFSPIYFGKIYFGMYVLKIFTEHKHGPMWLQPSRNKTQFETILMILPTFLLYFLWDWKIAKLQNFNQLKIVKYYQRLKYFEIFGKIWTLLVPQSKWIATAVLRRRRGRFAIFKALNLQFWLFSSKIAKYND